MHAAIAIGKLYTIIMPLRDYHIWYIIIMEHRERKRELIIVTNMALDLHEPKK